MKSNGKSFINRNRIIIGIVCLAVAVVGAFIVLPAISENRIERYDVYMLNTDIAAGQSIKEENVSTVKTSDERIAALTVYKKEQLAGMVAARNLKKDSYIYAADLTKENTVTIDNIPADKQIVSVAIKDIAMDVAYQLQAGDIVRVYAVDEKTGAEQQPKELKYVEIEGIYNAAGGNIAKLTGESVDYQPAAATLIVNDKQAKTLVPLSKKSNIYFSLISRGDLQKKQELLAEQSKDF